VLPARKVNGVKLVDGSQLEYPISGLLSSTVTLSLIIFVHYTRWFGDKYTLGWIADNYL
jgi:hypothetical protein